jgi:hypothetical protein
MSLKPGEVLQVHGDDRSNATREHRGDHVRVVDLLAPAFNVAEQAEQAIGDLGVLGEQRGSLADGAHIPERVREAQPEPVLLGGPRRDGEVMRRLG